MMMNDVLYEKVVNELEEMAKKTSITVTGFQRYLKESYPVCQSIINRLEAEGYISAWDEYEPRKVLKIK